MAGGNSFSFSLGASESPGGSWEELRIKAVSCQQRSWDPCCVMSHPRYIYSHGPFRSAVPTGTRLRSLSWCSDLVSDLKTSSSLSLKWFRAGLEGACLGLNRTRPKVVSSQLLSSSSSPQRVNSEYSSPVTILLT